MYWVGGMHAKPRRSDGFRVLTERYCMGLLGLAEEIVVSRVGDKCLISHIAGIKTARNGRGPSIRV